MTEVVGSRIGPTLLLFGLGEMIAIVVGLALGAYAGWRRGGAIDLVGNGVSLILYSMPYFLLGMILLLVFASTLHWFPSFGMTTLGVAHDSPLDYLADLSAHPRPAGGHRRAGADRAVLDPDALIDHRDAVGRIHHDGAGEGISETRILRGHALPNAMLPTVSLIAINLGYVVAGAITVEVVFNWPGLGTLTVEALTSRDYPVLQGIFLVLSISVVFADLR